ncbi:MAG: hypothetical protein JWM60_125 [Solirubrobacterales bacterium]|jgi:hypothetical protein|nr:hypothetical protein [Solirubrobacterales bacterium]
MRRAAVVLLGWGAWLAVLTAAQLAFAPVRPRSVGLHPIEYELLGGAAAACLLTGLGLWRLDLRRAAVERPRALPDQSLAAATLAAGLALALLGAGFGLWLILVGAGVTALGAGGLLREARARRRTRRLGGAP